MKKQRLFLAAMAAAFFIGTAGSVTALADGNDASASGDAAATGDASKAATAQVEKDSDNNGTAELAAELMFNQTVKDSLGPDDKEDWYKLTVPATQKVRFMFSSWYNTPEIKVYKASDLNNKLFLERNNLMYASPDKERTADRVLELPAGDYYIEVENFYSDNSGEYSIKCSNKKAEKITLSKTNVVCNGDDQYVYLEAKIVPEDAVCGDITWSSDNTSTAYVNDEGRVTPITAGFAKVTAKCADDGCVSATCNFTVKPDKVSNVYYYTGSTYTTQTKITIGWPAVSGADGYQIYKYNEKTKKFEKYKTTKKIQYTVKGLKADTKYKFKVAAYIKTPKGRVEGKQSKVGKCYTAPKAPAAPEITGIEKRQRTIYMGSPVRIFRLKWKKSKGATGYYVYRADKKTLVTTTTKPYADLYAGIGFTYKVYVVPYRTKHSMTTMGKKSKTYSINMVE